MSGKKEIWGSYGIKIASALLLLFVGSFLYLRLDASRDRAYSLTSQSKQTLRALRDKVVIKVFASQDLSPQLAGLNRALKDLLTEFQRQSRGKLVYEYVRARGNDDLIEQALEYNIAPYTVVTVENDRQITKQVVLGLSLEGAGKASALALKPGMEIRLEYQLLKLLNNLQNDALPEIAVFADSLSLMFQYSSNPDETATFFQEVMENFRMRYTDLNTPSDSADVMLCFGVVDSLSQAQLYNLDQFLMRGGKAVLCQDRVAVYNTPQGSAVVEIKSNLFNLLQHYGILIKPNVVLDAECEIRQGSALGTQVPYPFLPLIRANQAVPYTKGFDQIFLYMASELDSVPGSRIKFSPVLKSSDRSNVLYGPALQIDQAIASGLDPRYLNQPPKAVAAEYTGPVSSYFRGPLADTLSYQAKGSTQVIVFGDSELPLDFSAGAFIVLNAVDYLLGRDDMFKLRSPRSSDNVLGVDVYLNRRGIQPSDPERALGNLTMGFKLLAILLPLVLLAIFGIWRVMRQSAQNRS